MTGRTLQEWIEDVADRADVVVSPSGRHTPERVRRAVNRAIEAFAQIAVRAGDERMLRVHVTTTVPLDSEVVPGVPERAALVLPTDFFALRSVDIRATDRWVTLLDIEELERNDVQRRNEAPGVPRFFRVAGSYRLDGSPDTIQLLELYPAAAASYTLRIRYLPRAPQLTEDDDTFDALGFDDWLVNDAALRLLIRDGLGGTRMADDLRGWQQQLRGEMAQQMASRSRSTPRRRVDTRGMRRRLERGSPGADGEDVTFVVDEDGNLVVDENNNEVIL